MLKRGLSSKNVPPSQSILKACTCSILDYFLLSLHVCTVYSHTGAMQAPPAHCMSNSLNVTTFSVRQSALLTFTNSLLLLVVQSAVGGL